MAYNHEKNWFEYKGRYYGYGTIVKFKSETYQGLSEPSKLGGIFEFCKGWTSGWIQFKSTKPEISKIGMGDIWDPNDVIEYIVKPVYVELQPVWKKSVENYNKASPEHKHLAFSGTLWYIVVMAVVTLFYARWLIYVVATIVYVNYWINQYRD